MDCLARFGLPLGKMYLIRNKIFPLGIVII